MNKASLVLFGLGVAILSYWYALSEPRHLATLTQKLVKQDGTDDFGDPLPDKWVDVFEPGLDIYGGASATCFIVGGVLFVIARRRKTA